ncbi:MarC family protein [Egibacter rhizosphaerae]|uniref:UPF0056 membrane protein n=1 Tax=Egibacter rhizosphaerae TaxID=1670831 RepID=A0A411YIU1_9ACTN|nr:MarC family protein [Egibacter rhizosphaerae]QBI21225.1 MarC family protein [Egibacter rhizosphaerae]
MDLTDLQLDATLFAQAFVTVTVIMDPVGNVPVFLALTRGLDRAQKRRAAWQATGVAAGVIALFALVGEQLIALLGISFEALQVAGGLLLILVALELLRPAPDDPGAEVAKGRNVALVPLGTPLLAGPGAIAATMLYVSQSSTGGQLISVALALLAVHAIVFLGMRFSGIIERVLKENGIELVSRLLGFLLAAIAVQLIASAVADWIRFGVS